MYLSCLELAGFKWVNWQLPIYLVVYSLSELVLVIIRTYVLFLIKVLHVMQMTSKHCLTCVHLMCVSSLQRDTFPFFCSTYTHCWGQGIGSQCTTFSAIQRFSWVWLSKFELFFVWINAVSICKTEHHIRLYEVVTSAIWNGILYANSIWKTSSFSAHCLVQLNASMSGMCVCPLQFPWQHSVCLFSRRFRGCICDACLVN